MRNLDDVRARQKHVRLQPGTPQSFATVVVARAMRSVSRHVLSDEHTPNFASPAGAAINFVSRSIAAGAAVAGGPFLADVPGVVENGLCARTEFDLDEPVARRHAVPRHL